MAKAVSRTCARPRVLIIGGGFGGLNAARDLADAEADVTLVDRHNYHLFQPLLYQVATAVLSPGDIASPIRWILRRQTNVRVLLGEAQRVDLSRRTVEMRWAQASEVRLKPDATSEDSDRSREETESVPYDYLVLATGATHAYFGHDEWAAAAPGLKTLDDALEIRRRVLLALERAEREPDAAVRARLLTFVVIGGGPTGVELAGSFAELARQGIRPEYRAIDPSLVRVVLLEAGTGILGTFPPPLQESAQQALTRLGVEVRTGAAVTAVRAGAVEIGAERIDAETIVWAAGVAASGIGTTLGAPMDRAGRVLVQPDLTLADHPDVFVIGDLAAAADAAGRLLPGVAPVAIQQGRYVARAIRRRLALKNDKSDAHDPFIYRDPGTMATIGRRAAVADFGRVQLTGWVAWIAWLVVHLLQLIGFRNRAIVLLQWAWSYVTYQRNVRLITGDRPRVRG